MDGTVRECLLSTRKAIQMESLVIPCNLQTAKAWGMNEGDLFKCEPYLQIKTTDGSHAMWVPSIRDVLAEDWEYIH